MTACTLASLGRFDVFFFWLVVWCSTRLPPQRKLLCKSHSSLNSVWWAVLTLKLGSEQSLAYISKKSVIHAVVNVFWFFSVMFLSDLQSCFFCSGSLVSLLTGACCNLHATQFFKCYRIVLDQGKTPFSWPCSAVTLPMLFYPAFFIISVLLLWSVLHQPDLYFSKKIHLSWTMRSIL